MPVGIPESFLGCGWVLMGGRLRKFERLESRQLLTAYINEVLFSPLFGNSDRDQYVELRGEPNAALAAGTYLLVVESGKGFNNAEGKIEVIINLSGLRFGSNGFLVLLPQESPFTPDPRATTLRSNAPGFGGLPDNRFSDVHELSDRLDFIYASNTIFLIQSDVPPLLGDDIDTNSDGFVDTEGVFANWNVLDSASTLWSLNDGHGYGKVVFIDRMGHNPAVTIPPENTLVVLEGTGYVGRIGNSTGWAATDWVGGTVKDINGDSMFYRLAGDVHGRPRPFVFQGRELDSVGSENFTAAVRAQFFRDLNGNGVRNPGEPSLAGVQLLADTNANGMRDLITTIIEPDNFNTGIEIDNLTKGVSLATAVNPNADIRFDIQVVQAFGQPTGTHIFSHAGVGFFNSSRRFRADFYRPAQRVSMDFIGDSNITPTYGRLEAFNAQGQSIQMLRTSPLGSGGRQTLSIDAGADSIAFVVAYSDDDFQNSSPFGRLDRFTFAVPEAIASTDDDGWATLNFLDPDQYLVTEYQSNQPVGYIIDPIPIEITKYENFRLDVPVRVNEPPVLTPQDFSINENATAGTTIGTVAASDDPSQSIRYTLLTGTQHFTIDTLTGVLKVKSGATLNYEQQKQFVVRVRATDNAPSPLSAEADMTIKLNDLNEPPVMSNQPLEIAENPQAGAIIGVVRASDPDAGLAGELNYQIVGNNPNQAFALNGETGELTVNNPLAFNFETTPQLVLSVRAADNGSPSLSVTRNVTVTVANVNEPPTITSSTFRIGELAAPGSLIGRVLVTDPEPLQFHVFRWADEFSSDEFTIDSNNGEIRLAPGAALDFSTKSLYEVHVHVTDSGLPTGAVTKRIQIEITDENNPPVFNDLSSLSIPENASQGDVIGAFSASDRDAGTEFTFAILAGNAGEQFALDASTGELSVARNNAFDFESKAEWEISVQVTDNGTPRKSATKAFVVNISDVNEPPLVNPASFSLAENSTAGSLVGKVNFSDPDAADSITITIVDSPDAGRFNIDSHSGNITVKEGAVLDFEGQNRFIITVSVTDGVTQSVQAEVEIQLSDVNEPPQIVRELEPQQFTAAIEFSWEIPGDLFRDVDAGQNLSLELVDPNLPWLAFDTNTRRISGLAWNGSVGNHSLTLRATDNGTPPLHIDLPWTIEILANASPWQNPDDPFDVNGRSDVTPADALVIINYLNRSNLTNIPSNVDFRPNFLDVSGNNKIEPLDALQVINYLNRRNVGGEGEASSGALVSVGPASSHDLAILDFVSDPLRKRRWR